MSAICTSRKTPARQSRRCFATCAGRKPRRENPSGIAAFHRGKAAARSFRDVGDLHVSQNPRSALPALFRRCAGRKPRRENPSGIAAFHRGKAAARSFRDVGNLHLSQTRQSFAAAQAETLEGKTRQESQPFIAVRRQRAHLGMSAICTSHKPGSLSSPTQAEKHRTKSPRQKSQPSIAVRRQRVRLRSPRIYRATPLRDERSGVALMSPSVHISLRPLKALESVTSSVYSRSAPTGMPWAMRVTRMPMGFMSRAM